MICSTTSHSGNASATKYVSALSSVMASLPVSLLAVSGLVTTHAALDPRPLRGRSRARPIARNIEDLEEPRQWEREEGCPNYPALCPLAGRAVVRTALR